MVREDHLLEGKCCEVGSDCVIRNLPDHKGKVAAVGMLTVHAYVFVSVHVSENLVDLHNTEFLVHKILNLFWYMYNVRYVLVCIQIGSHDEIEKLDDMFVNGNYTPFEHQTSKKHPLTDATNDRAPKKRKIQTVSSRFLRLYTTLINNVL